MTATVDGTSGITAPLAVIIEGATSGQATISPPAVAGTPTLTLPTVSDTLVGRATTDTLTNKTISAASNTITGLGITLATPVASTSGTSIDYTGLPTGLKQINLMLKGVSTSGTSSPMVQIGPSSGVEATAYAGGASNGAGTTTAYTTGFTLKASTHAAADIINGLYILSFENSSANSWCSSGVGFWSSTLQQGINSASKSIAGVLSRIRFTTIGGTDTFDAGEVNISYQ